MLAHCSDLTLIKDPLETLEARRRKEPLCNNLAIEKSRALENAEVGNREVYCEVRNEKMGPFLVFDTADTSRFPSIIGNYCDGLKYGRFLRVGSDGEVRSEETFKPVELKAETTFR
jgi:hypothetical protein